MDHYLTYMGDNGAYESYSLLAGQMEEQMQS